METLKTEKLSLRPVEPSDTEAVFSIYSAERVCEFYDLTPFTALTQARSHVEQWIENSKEGKQSRFAIILNEKVVGTCGLYSLLNPHRRASLGYDLLPEYWGQGYMSEALSVFVPFAMNYFDLVRLQALVMSGHQASSSLLEKLGFQFEGTLRKYEKWEGKGWVDLDCYSLLR